ncbi:hypothetical protein Lalb_Chr19g0132541 [Lupinus albus]|uniref:Uncharacterized protein n=1 Tax=Lupinus albus TaxID=3870 RepID=A0A6A4NTN3_LUPAL|nr:hypothetical protein Lalb_Chr19g0132541 [Lupinus albus]
MFILWCNMGMDKRGSKFQYLFKEWLSRCGDPNKFSYKKFFPLSARAIVQAWAERRDYLKHTSFHSINIICKVSLAIRQEYCHNYW